MRVAVVSSATFTEQDLGVLDELCRKSQYCCTRVDTPTSGIGGVWAQRQRLPISWLPTPRRLPLEVEALILLWDGKAEDAATLLRMARGRGLLVYARVATPKTP